MFGSYRVTIHFLVFFIVYLLYSKLPLRMFILPEYFETFYILLFLYLDDDILSPVIVITVFLPVYCPGVLCDEPDPLLPVLRAAGARGRPLPGEVLLRQGQHPAPPAGGIQQLHLHLQNTIYSTGRRIFDYYSNTVM